MHFCEFADIVHFWVVGIPQLPNGAFGKFAMDITTRHKPSLSCSIAHVVGCGSGEKVIGVNASGIIAAMADKTAVPYGADKKLVADTVGQLGHTHNSDAPITLTVAGSLPFPTGISGRRVRFR